MKPACSCPLGCRSRAEMRAAHGTPVQYEDALHAAWDLVREVEAAAQIRKYRAEYYAAPEAIDDSVAPEGWDEA